MQALLAVDLGADLRVHVADRVDHAEVEVAPEHERPHDGVQRGDVGRVARDRARLDPGITFPFAALYDQVVLDHVQARHERARFAVWPQGHVDAEREPVFRHLGQRGDQLAAQAHEEFVVRQRFLAGAGAGVAVFRVDEDEVDVGRDVQFAAAMLAHRQHHHLLGAAGVVTDGLAVQRRHLGHQFGDVGLDGEVGEAAHRGDDFVEIGEAVQVAPDDGADEQVAQAAHGARRGQGRAVRPQRRFRLQRCAEIERGQR